MKSNQRRLAPALLLILALLSSACAPLVIPSAGVPATGVTEATPGEAPADATEAETSENRATATVITRSLRVRTEPAENAEVIAGLEEGDQYPVLGISSDGLWVELAIDSAPGGSGWVAASFVSVEGPITDAAITQTPTTSIALSPTGVISPAVSISPTGVLTGVTAIATPAPGFALVRTDGTRLRVRSEPSTEAEIVGYVYNGESYAVLETSADGQWVLIGGGPAPTDNPNGGWVAAEFVVIGE